jgi:hypothetical protein
MPGRRTGGPPSRTLSVSARPAACHLPRRVRTTGSANLSDQLSRTPQSGASDGDFRASIDACSLCSDANRPHRSRFRGGHRLALRWRGCGFRRSHDRRTELLAFPVAEPTASPWCWARKPSPQLQQFRTWRTETAKQLCKPWCISLCTRHGRYHRRRGAPMRSLRLA